MLIRNRERGGAFTVLLDGVALAATLGHYCMTRAFKVAPMTVTQPVTFLQLIWATLLGALVFGEGIDSFVLLGGAIIIAAISLVTLGEARDRRLAAEELTSPQG